jgi:hypothetical protein
LKLPDYLGWIHVVAPGSESVDSVTERARLHPPRIAVLAAPQPADARDFLGELSAADADLFLMLDETESPGMVILDAMTNRAPYAFGAHILRHRLPEFADITLGGDYLALSCLRLFVAMPFAERKSAPLWRNAYERAEFAEIT